MVNSRLVNLLLDAAKVASIVPRESRHLSKEAPLGFRGIILVLQFLTDKVLDQCDVKTVI